MTLRGQKSVIWAPAGTSDMLDSSEEEFPGALALCQNLIPAQNNRGMMVARPAAVKIAGLPDYGGGPLTCMVAVGNTIYGMYASTAFPNQDRPFSYNLTTGTFATITGMTAGNLPISPAQTGDWTPPTAENIATRILFTHPGFPGGKTETFLPNYPGSYSFYVNTTNGSPTLTGNANATLGQVAGLPPVGSLLIGTGIPLGTTVLSAAVAVVNTTATGTSPNNNFTVASATGIFIGQVASANGAAGIVTNVAGTTITISANLTSNLSATPIQFVGTTITMSANATATANNVAINSAANNNVINFGWLDISNLSVSVMTNTLIGSTILSGGFNPSTLGIQPGLTITGTGIPAGTTVIAAAPLVVTVSATTTINTSQITFSGSPSNFPFAWGWNVAGLGIPPASIVTNVSGPSTSNQYTLQLNQAATASGTVTLTISGGYIQMSAAATANSIPPNVVTVTIAGGTVANPLWGSGDTQGTPLVGIPVFVRQLAGSAIFGINTNNPPTSGVTFSDPGIPCQVSSANQAITFQNAVPVTAAKGLPLENQLGGIIQSLVVFQGASNIQQITGSVALGNITVNTSQVATGTFAPNSVASTPKGLVFASPFGLRMIDFDGRVTDPIGSKGMGVVIPFQNAVRPTRMASAFNENIYRVTITWQPPTSSQFVWGNQVRTDEFWLHFDTMRFTGPHTSLMDLAAPWISNETFVCGLSSGRGSLWQSDPDQGPASAYTENGTALSFTLRTVLLPDDETMYANSLVESSMFASMLAQYTWLAVFIDDQGVTLDQASIWLGPTITQSQLPIYWAKPIAFRQGAVQITGPADSQTLIGQLELRYQKLKYQLPFRPSQAFVLGQTVLGDDGALQP